MSSVLGTQDEANLLPDDDTEDNFQSYNQLHEAISQLDNVKRIRPAKRNELGSLVSEFHVNQQNSRKLHAKDLAGVLEKKNLKDTKINRKAKKVSASLKPLAKPLEKPAAALIKRQIGFEIVNQQLSGWDAVVESNRMSDQLNFPLNAPKFHMQEGKDFFSNFKPTELQQELNAVLHGESQQELVEEKEEFPLTLEEMIERRKELVRIRARQSYREAKAQRQNKIKSKKYHRMQKREKVKQQFKDFEALMKTDPEEAMKKLDELEKTRALERATLKHRNTGKWAQNLAVRAKYNEESRKVLAEQLTISREATQKLKNNDSSDEEDGSDLTLLKDAAKIAENNPWSLEVSSDVNSFISGFRKYWTLKNKSAADSEEPAIVNVEPQNGSEETLSKPVDNENSLDQENELEMTELKKCGTPIKNIGASKKWTVTPDKNSDNVLPRDVGPTTTPLKKHETPVKNVKAPAKWTVTPDKNNDNVLSRDVGPLKKHGTPVKNIKAPAKWTVTPVRSSDSVGSPKAGKVPPGITTDSLNKEIESEMARVKKYVTPIKNKVTADNWTVTPIQDNGPGLQPRAFNFDIDRAFDMADQKLIGKIAEKFKTLRDISKPTSGNFKKLLHSKENARTDLKMKKSRWHVERVQMDEELQDYSKEQRNKPTMPEVSLGNAVETIDDKTSSQVNIDPQKFLKVKKSVLNTPLPEDITGEDDEAMEDEEQQQLIMEAFADDDVADFMDAKAAENAKTKPTVVEELPGWGSWGGVGIAPKKRKQGWFYQMPTLRTRKDHDKQDVIINEDPNPKIVEHMVKEVPYPFKSVDAFEANIRAPISREWVPELAQRELVKPAVVTRQGTIIEPISDDILIRNRPKSRSPFPAKVKRAVINH